MMDTILMTHIIWYTHTHICRETALLSKDLSIRAPGAVIHDEQAKARMHIDKCQSICYSGYCSSRYLTLFCEHCV